MLLAFYFEVTKLSKNKFVMFLSYIKCVSYMETNIECGIIALPIFINICSGNEFNPFKKIRS
jgi:hypothetical protein